MLARTYAAETEKTNVKVNLFNPGPTRTRMRAQAMPGEDPMTLDPPHKVAEHVLQLCLPELRQERDALRLSRQEMDELPRAGVIISASNTDSSPRER